MGELRGWRRDSCPSRLAIQPFRRSSPRTSQAAGQIAEESRGFGVSSEESRRGRDEFLRRTALTGRRKGWASSHEEVEDVRAKSHATPELLRAGARLPRRSLAPERLPVAIPSWRFRAFGRRPVGRDRPLAGPCWRHSRAILGGPRNPVCARQYAPRVRLDDGPRGLPLGPGRDPAGLAGRSRDGPSAVAAGPRPGSRPGRAGRRPLVPIGVVSRLVPGRPDRRPGRDARPQPVGGRSRGRLGRRNRADGGDGGDDPRRRLGLPDARAKAGVRHQDRRRGRLRRPPRCAPPRISRGGRDGSVLGGRRGRRPSPGRGRFAAGGVPGSGRLRPGGPARSPRSPPSIAGRSTGRSRGSASGSGGWWSRPRGGRSRSRSSCRSRRPSWAWCWPGGSAAVAKRGRPGRKRRRLPSGMASSDAPTMPGGRGSPIMGDESLERWIGRLNEGDVGALEHILPAFEPYLRIVVRRRLGRGLRSKVDSRDIVQSVFANVVGGRPAGGLAVRRPGPVAGLPAADRQEAGRRPPAGARRRTLPGAVAGGDRAG